MILLGIGSNLDSKFGNRFSRLITTIIIFDTKPGLLLSDTINKQINLFKSYHNMVDFPIDYHKIPCYPIKLLNLLLLQF